MLNKATLKSVNPLRHIDDIFDRFRRVKYFAKLDLRFGCHQTLLEPESVILTAFRTKHGFFEFPVLPFGLRIQALPYVSFFGRRTGAVKNMHTSAII